MSIRELLEEGDTGEALLPAKVNDQGVHADRDGSEAQPWHRGQVMPAKSVAPTLSPGRPEGPPEEAPRADNPLHGSARTRGASESLSRLELLKSMTDRERHLMLCFLSGSAPQEFDRAARCRELFQ